MITTDPFQFDPGEKGLAVVAVDPGEGVGLAYACLARKELALGVVGALKAARRHSSGLLLEDKRYMVHDLKLGMGGPPIDEINLAHEIVNWIVMWGNMANRTSGGVVERVNVVVIEDFVLGLLTQDRSLLSPVRITAMVELLLQDRPELFYIVKQSSANAKHNITDDRLKKWGFYVPGVEHRKDAVRHLMLYLRSLTNQMARA